MLSVAIFSVERHTHELHGEADNYRCALDRVKMATVTRLAQSAASCGLLTPSDACLTVSSLSVLVCLLRIYRNYIISL